jgi:ParB family chromosome partitioning protein
MCLQKLSAKNLGKTEDEAESIRVETTQKVIAKKLSIKETRSEVSFVMSSLAASSPKPPRKTKQVDGIIQRVQSMSIEKVGREQLAQLKEALQQKLKEIESALSE